MEHDFIERRTAGAIENRIVRLEERSMAAAEALRLASLNVEKRLELMNELRDQIAQERGNYMSRAEYDIKHELLVTTIHDLQKFQWTITGGLIVMEMLIAVILHYWR